MAQLERPTIAAARSRRPVVTSIGKVQPRDHVRVAGLITAATPMSISGFPACRYTLADDTGEIDLMFLGRVVVAGLEPGQYCTAEGTAAARDGRVAVWNPRYQIVPLDEAAAADGMAEARCRAR